MSNASSAVTERAQAGLLSSLAAQLSHCGNHPIVAHNVRRLSSIASASGGRSVVANSRPLESMILFFRMLLTNNCCDVGS